MYSPSLAWINGNDEPLHTQLDSMENAWVIFASSHYAAVPGQVGKILSPRKPQMSNWLQV